MTTNEYLLSVKRLDNLINEKLEEIYRIKTIATSKTVPYDRERVQCSPNYDRQGDFVSQIVDLEKDVDMLTDILVDTKRNIRSICKAMNPKYADIIIKKYVQGNSLSQIAKDYNYNIGNMKYHHKKAVNEFKEHYISTKYSIDVDTYHNIC